MFIIITTTATVGLAWQYNLQHYSRTLDFVMNALPCSWSKVRGMMVAQMFAIMCAHPTRHSPYTTQSTLRADSSLMANATLVTSDASLMPNATLRASGSSLMSNSSLMTNATLMAAVQATAPHSTLSPVALIVSIKELGVHGTGTSPSLDSTLESACFDSPLAPRVEVALELDCRLAAASWLA